MCAVCRASLEGLQACGTELNQMVARAATDCSWLEEQLATAQSPWMDRMLRIAKQAAASVCASLSSRVQALKICSYADYLILSHCVSMTAASLSPCVWLLPFDAVIRLWLRAQCNPSVAACTVSYFYGCVRCNGGGQGTSSPCELTMLRCDYTQQLDGSYIQVPHLFPLPLSG